MGLRRLDHNRIPINARLLGDLRADHVRVVAGDDGEIQDHQADAPPARLEDDGLGIERIDHGLRRAVVTGSAAGQMRSFGWGYVDHRRAGAQLV